MDGRRGITESMIESSIDFLIQFFLSAMAVYRVSYMIAVEDGPFDLYVVLRAKFNQATWIGRGLACPLCISWWLSMIPAVFMPHFFLLDWLAIAGFCLILHKRINIR